MTEALLLVEGKNVSEDKLRSLSLANAKQLVYGRFAGGGHVLHVATDTHANLQTAILKFAGVAGVSSVLTLAVRQV